MSYSVRSSITSTRSAKPSVSTADDLSCVSDSKSCHRSGSMKSKSAGAKPNKKVSSDNVSRYNLITSNHVHYDVPKKQKISYINLKIRKLYKDSEVVKANAYSYVIKVECNRPENVWILRRNVADFKTLDHILHGGCRGIDSFRDRGLSELHPPETIDSGHNSYSQVYLQYSNYLDTLSGLLDPKITKNGNLLLIDRFVCSLLQRWFEISLDGYHKIHMPNSRFQPGQMLTNAVVKIRYPRQALGDLTLEVGDIVTVTESLVPTDSSWARGKSDKTFLNGLFPACCVEDFNFDNTHKPDYSQCPVLESLVKEAQSSKTNQGASSSNTTTSGAFSLPGIDSKMGHKSTLQSIHGSRKNNPNDPHTSGQPIEERISVSPVFGSTLYNAMQWNYTLKDDKKKFVVDSLYKIFTDEFCEVSLSHVPYFVQTMVDFIHKNGEVDGIYRLSGSSSEIATIIQMIDSGVYQIDFSHFDIHSTSSALKQFFRDLSMPIIPVESYNDFMAPFDKYPNLIQQNSNSRSDVINSEKESKVSEKELNHALNEIQENLYRLPFYHYHTLKLLMLHLRVFVSKSSITSMGLYNLAIMWAPNLLFDPFEKECTDYIEIAKRAKASAAKKGKLVELLITHSNTLFNDHLPKSILQEINAKGCEDKLRGCQPEFESKDFEVITKSANSVHQTLTLPRSFNVNVPGKDRMKKVFKNLFPSKYSYSTSEGGGSSKRDRSASVIGHCYVSNNQQSGLSPKAALPRDDFSVESGMYSFINNDVKSCPNGNYASADFLSKTDDYTSPSLDFLSSKQDDDDSETDISDCNSDDSTIGQFTDNVKKKRKGTLMSPEAQEQKHPPIFTDPESHIYSHIQKSENNSKSSDSKYSSTTFTVHSNPWDTRSEEDSRSFLTEFNSGALVRGSELGEDFPLIDSPPPTSTTRTPGRYVKGNNSSWSSKDSALGSAARKKSIPILSSNHNQYNYSAGQNLDNYCSDRVFTNPRQTQASKTSVTNPVLLHTNQGGNINSAYKRYFNASPARSGSAAADYRSKSRPETPAKFVPASATSRSEAETSTALLFRSPPAVVNRPLIDSPPIKNRTDVTVVSTGAGDKYSTNCSFDSGVENNASSNDEL